MKAFSQWRLGLKWQPPFPPRASHPVSFARRPRLLPLVLAASISSSASQYELIELVEDLEKYQPGGYHPICLDDRLQNRYRVVHKLGHGTFSTVWLARDQQTQQHGAVEVGIADAPSKEIDTLKYLTEMINASINSSTGAAMIPIVKDHFTIDGPNGNHPCLVTNLARCSLSDSKQEGGRGLFQLDVFRSLAAQLILAVCFVHSQGYCHGGMSLNLDTTSQLPAQTHLPTVSSFYFIFCALDLLAHMLHRSPSW